MRLISWNGPIIERPTTNNQTISPNGGILEEREHVFRVEFDEPVPDEFIYAQRQCPTFFSYMVFRSGIVSQTCFVTGRSIQQLADLPQVYDVKITYANQWGNTQNQDSPNVQFQWIPNPLARPASVEWTSYIAREAVEFSLDDDENSTIPVTTSAGEPLVLEEERHYRRLIIQKNVKQVTKIFAEGEYINEEDTTIGGHTFKKLTLWLLPIEIGHVHVENRIIYFPITMTLLHNPRTWIRQLRNAGYYMKSLNPKVISPIDDPAARKTIFPLEPIRFQDGSKADRPILLYTEGPNAGRPIQMVVTGLAPDPSQPPNPRQANPRIRYIKTYEIQSPEQFGRAFTQEELKQSTLYHRTKKKLNFTKNLPLT